MTRRTATYILLLATLAMAAACCVVAAGCSSQTLPYGEIDGKPAEAVWMTKGQLREYDEWLWEKHEQESNGRVVDTLLWQFDCSRGLAVRIPIEQPERGWCGDIVQTDGFDDWRILSIEALEGPPDRPTRFLVVQGASELSCEEAIDLCWFFVVRSGDLSDLPDGPDGEYSLQVRLHSCASADLTQMKELLERGRGVQFIRRGLE